MKSSIIKAHETEILGTISDLKKIEEFYENLRLKLEESEDAEKYEDAIDSIMDCSIMCLKLKLRINQILKHKI